MEVNVLFKFNKFKPSQVLIDTRSFAKFCGMNFQRKVWRRNCSNLPFVTCMVELAVESHLARIDSHKYSLFDACHYFNLQYKIKQFHRLILKNCFSVCISPIADLSSAMDITVLDFRLYPKNAAMRNKMNISEVNFRLKSTTI